MNGLWYERYTSLRAFFLPSVLQPYFFPFFLLLPLPYDWNFQDVNGKESQGRKTKIHTRERGKLGSILGQWSYGSTSTPWGRRWLCRLVDSSSTHILKPPFLFPLRDTTYIIHIPKEAKHLFWNIDLLMQRRPAETDRHQAVIQISWKSMRRLHCWGSWGHLLFLGTFRGSRHLLLALLAHVLVTKLAASAAKLSWLMGHWFSNFMIPLKCWGTDPVDMVGGQ